MLKVEVTYNYSEVDSYLWEAPDMGDVLNLVQRLLEDDQVADFKLEKK